MISLKKLTINQICQAIEMDDDLRLTVAENMKQYGGSFVKALGECLLHADHNNRYKIAEAFTNYILEYAPEKWSKK